MAVTMSETAATEIQNFMKAQESEEGTMVRVAVAGGGCSGLQYGLGFDTKFDPEIDAKFEQHGVSIVTRKKFAVHLSGTTIDFKDGPTGRGFAVENPNWQAGGGCPGCGG